MGREGERLEEEEEKKKKRGGKRGRGKAFNTIRAFIEQVC
jgi:hypothetical protein